MKNIVKKLPLVGSVARTIHQRWSKRSATFSGSKNYWIERYATGGNSGDGSYRQLAEFKAETINSFVRQHNIKSIIEYGCGDGNQLSLATYPQYLGFDVSPLAVSKCQARYGIDTSKLFRLADEYRGETAELTLSLDVIYHLVEDDVFTAHMNRLFLSSQRFVIIYSSNTNENSSIQSPHVKHRCFTAWVEENKPEWYLIKHIPNRYPYRGDTQTGSFADFYVYEHILR